MFFVGGLCMNLQHDHHMRETICRDSALIIIIKKTGPRFPVG